MKHSFFPIALAAASFGLAAVMACSSSDDSGGTTSSSGSSGTTTSSASSSGTTSSTSSSSGSTTSSSGSTTSSTSSGGTDSGTDSGEAPTFTTVYTTVIATKCSPCHTEANGSGVNGGKLDMTSQAAAYTDLVGAASAGEACNGMGTRVVAGSAATSVMYEKVAPGVATPCGSKMPLGSMGLDATSAATIEDWINAGALNN